MSNFIKYIILEKLILENRIQQVKGKYPCVPGTIINYLSESDPSNNNKYLDWMVNEVWVSQTYDGNYPTISDWLNSSSREDEPCQNTWKRITRVDFDKQHIEGFKDLCDDIIDVVRNFHRFSPTLEKKDINQYTYGSLINTLASKVLKAQEKLQAKNVNKIYEDNTWLILSPKTHESSCVYGANTKWCVTMRDDSSYFEDYTKDDFYLIFVINKKTNRKWAINTQNKLGGEEADVETINIPWHREVNLQNKGGRISTRFPVTGHNASVERARRNKSQVKTTYWDNVDNLITWTTFITQSDLPKKLQELLKQVERKIIFNFERKKRGDIAYEINPKPVRLKKGDRVKFLASGFGIYRGDEGIIVATRRGAPGRQRDLTNDDAGQYLVYVPTREPYVHYRYYTMTDSGGNNIPVKVIGVNGNYLEKIPKK